MEGHKPTEPLVAEFRGYKEFDHFSDARHPECFACNSWQMKVRPLVVTDDYVLLDATTRDVDQFVIMPGMYLVFPRIHLENFMDMPGDWTASVQDAVAFLELQGQALNLSDNWGWEAGQTVPHGHTWVINRSTLKEKGSKIDVGLATLLYRGLGLNA